LAAGFRRVQFAEDLRQMYQFRVEASTTRNSLQSHIDAGCNIHLRIHIGVIGIFERILDL